MYFTLSARLTNHWVFYQNAIFYSLLTGYNSALDEFILSGSFQGNEVLASGSAEISGGKPVGLEIGSWGMGPGVVVTFVVVTLVDYS